MIRPSLRLKGRRRQSGFVLALFAVALIPIMGLFALMVDLGRASVASIRLQTASEAALVVAARSHDRSNGNRDAVLQDSFARSLQAFFRTSGFSERVVVVKHGETIPNHADDAVVLILQAPVVSCPADQATSCNVDQNRSGFDGEGRVFRARTEARVDLLIFPLIQPFLGTGSETQWLTITAEARVERQGAPFRLEAGAPVPDRRYVILP